MTTVCRPAVSPAKANCYLALATILWGGSFLFTKIALRDIHPVSFMFFRFSLASLVMALVFMKRLPGLNRGTFAKGVIVGSALAAVNLTFVLGVAGTTISRAGFLNNLFVLLVPLLCFLLWREPVSRFNLAAVLLALGGLVLLAGGGAAGFSRGDLLSTVCAFFIALHIIVVSRLLKHEDVFLVSLVQFATVALAGGAILLQFPEPRAILSTTSVTALLYCALFPTVVCFTLQNAYQRYTTPTRAGLIYTLDPVWSLLSGMLFLGERLSPREWLGCAFIFGGVLLPLVIHLLQERRAPDYLGAKVDVSKAPE